MYEYNNDYDFINEKPVQVKHAGHNCMRIVDIARGIAPTFTVTTYICNDSSDCLCKNSPYILRYGL